MSELEDPKKYRMKHCAVGASMSTSRCTINVTLDDPYLTSNRSTDNQNSL